jgi:hypothetical protein
MRVLDSNLSQWEKKPKQVPKKKPQILLFWCFATTTLVQASKQAPTPSVFSVAAASSSSSPPPPGAAAAPGAVLLIFFVCLVF